MQKKIIIGVFIFFILIFGIAGLFNQAEVSFSERRKLAAMPKIVEKGKLNQDYFEELDKYLTDHFVGRDEFRQIKAYFNNEIFRLSDNNNIFIKDDKIFEMDAQIDEKSIAHLADLTASVNEKYFLGQDIYYALVPRKNDYLINDQHPDFNYQDFYNQLANQLKNPLINLYDKLDINSYYRTDIHWRMDKIENVAKYLVESMGDTYVHLDYEAKYFEPFYGALYGKAASFVKPDQLVYLDSSLFNDVSVYSYEKQKDVPVYDLARLNDLDAYDVYVDGPSAFIDIKNPNCENNQKLIIFRDSFASSLLPLLIPSYAEIQVVDLRYFKSNYLDLLELNEDAKVLYIYGLEVANHSAALK